MVALNYKIKGEGEPIVLIHGHPFDHTMWEPQISGFSSSYKVITPDLRGYGSSSLPAGKTTFEDYATDVLQLLDHLKISRFHLGGLSLGGQLIMEIFRQAPDKVISLIFADTFVSNDTPEIKQGRYDTAIRLEREGMDNYANEVIGKMIRREHVTACPMLRRMCSE